jgi:ferrochelatase
MNANAGKSPPRRKFAVLLLAHGVPETLDQIPEYLKNVVSGRRIPPHVAEEIRQRYERIGGKSPLTEWTMREAALLQEQIGFPVYVGMRNWRPYIADTVRAMKADGVTDAVAICMAPQNSRTSVGLYRRAAYAEAGQVLRLHFISSWADHPRLIDAFAERMRATWIPACRDFGAKIPVVFTAHSVPARTVEPQTAEAHDARTNTTAEGDTHSVEPYDPVRTIHPTDPARSYALPAGAASGPDPYADQARQTAALVAARLSAEGLTAGNWRFAFQSQGASGGPGSTDSWLGPTVQETLQALRSESHRGVVLQPIGFLCDHVEILYDVDIAFRQLATSLRMKLFRPESLNDSPLLIEALADLSLRGIAALQTDSTPLSTAASTPA